MTGADAGDDAGVDDNVKLGRRLLCLAGLGLFSALTLFVPSGATWSTQAPTDAELAVSSISFGSESLTAISVASDAPTASVRIFVPEGYALDLSQPAGTELGYVTAAVSDAAGSSFAFVSGDLLVDDPARYATEERAQRCAPGTHAAVWSVELSLLGQSLSLPIFLDLGTAGSGSGAAVLRFCPIWQAPDGARVLMAAYLTLLVEEAFALPTVPDRYTWSALLEPALLGSLTPDPTRTYELRSVVPHPHAMTLRARHDPKARSVVLSGKVTAVGLPEPGVKVSFSASLESSDEFTSFGPVTTNASGEFSVRRRIEQTTRFSASAEGQTRPCSTPSTVPAGCLAETVSPPLGASVIVRVRGALDSKLEPRRREQALARRINLKLGDFPAGWQAFPFPNPFFPCPGFKPNLSKLTVQGEAESPVFVTEQAAAAWSKTSIYASEPEARTAFEREASLAAARCVAAEARREGTTVRSVAPVSFPRLSSQTRAFRIVFSDPEESGYLDLVSIRQGRAVIHLGFVATNELAIERSLAAKVAARARAA